MTYKLFTHVYRTEPFKHRSALAKFRIESEEHVLLACSLYEDLRQVMENNLRSEFSNYGSL